MQPRNRFSPESIRAAMKWVGMPAESADVTAAADHLANLAGIYTELDSIRPPRAHPGDGDEFTTAPYPNPSSSDPYNAWIHRFELARATAGELDGLTVGVKDNICVRGAEMTVGSHAFTGTVPGGHAAVVDRLLDAGATLLGKTNMDEFAFSPTGETSAFGPTLNPVDPAHVTGGSSSGSAAAVAAESVDFALGTDTGGSVRIPASFCGIVGIKPTYGTVPLHGVVELAYTLDHVGVLARSLEMAARGLRTIADRRPDGTPICTSPAPRDPAAMTLGVAEQFFAGPVTDDVAAVVRGQIDRMADSGATIREIEFDRLADSRPVWWGITPVEFATMVATNGSGIGRTSAVEPSIVHALSRIRWAGSEMIGSNIFEMIGLGAMLLRNEHALAYITAQQHRSVIQAEFDDALESVDAIVTPTTPMTALELGEFDRGTTPPVNWDTHPTNITGHPSISIPASETDPTGMPVGIQLIGAAHDEQSVFDIAATFME